MAMPGARVPNKPPLVAAGAIAGAYPAVGQLRAGTLNALADRFAETVQDLVAHGVVSDYNQCCLLLKSTKRRLGTPRSTSTRYATEASLCTTPATRHSSSSRK
jgi:hypothetical protein